MSAKNDRCYIAAFVSGLLGIILLRVEKHKKRKRGDFDKCYVVLYCSTNYYFNSDYILFYISCLHNSN